MAADDGNYCYCYCCETGEHCTPKFVDRFNITSDGNKCIQEQCESKFSFQCRGNVDARKYPLNPADAGIRPNHTPAIIGGVVGAAIVLAIIAAFLYYRRRLIESNVLVLEDKPPQGFSALPSEAK